MKKHKFVLLHKNGGEWVYDKDNHWASENGKKYGKDRLWRIIKIQVADRYEDLDHSITYLNDRHSGVGWLDRNGKFYGCPPNEHSQYARLILHRTMVELNEQGWVHIQSTMSHKYSYTCKVGMSAEQKNWLAMRGFIL